MRAQLGDMFMHMRIIVLARGPLRMRIPSRGCNYRGQTQLFVVYYTHHTLLLMK